MHVYIDTLNVILHNYTGKYIAVPVYINYIKSNKF